MNTSQSLKTAKVEENSHNPAIQLPEGNMWLMFTNIHTRGWPRTRLNRRKVLWGVAPQSKLWALKILPRKVGRLGSPQPPHFWRPCNAIFSTCTHAQVILPPGWDCILNCFMLSFLPCFLTFLLFCYPCISFNVFTLVVKQLSGVKLSVLRVVGWTWGLVATGSASWMLMHPHRLDPPPSVHLTHIFL